VQYLVIMRPKQGTTADQLAPLLKPEAAKSWELMAAGILRSVHFIKGPTGAVLLFEAGDEQEVEAHLGQLPMVASGVATVEVLPLVPFTGWAALFASPPA
jgi:muconolactone delta-isomerase